MTSAKEAPIEAIQARAAADLSEHLDECDRCQTGFLCAEAYEYMKQILEGSEG